MQRNKCVIKSAIIELFAIGYFGVMNTKSPVNKAWKIVQLPANALQN